MGKPLLWGGFFPEKGALLLGGDFSSPIEGGCASRKRVGCAAIVVLIFPGDSPFGRPQFGEILLGEKL